MKVIRKFVDKFVFVKILAEMFAHALQINDTMLTESIFRVGGTSERNLWGVNN